MASRWRCPILELDNANESSNELRDNRNGQVAMITGPPALPSIAMTLACPPAKCIRTRGTAEAKSALHRPSGTERNQKWPTEHQPGAGGCGRKRPQGFCEILWACFGKPCLASRASTCNLPQILCRMSACRGLCTSCFSRQPSVCPHTLMPACSKFTRTLSSLAFAVDRRR